MLNDFLQSNMYSNVQVNSYCSFEPGGAFYTINGIAKFDEENNGCDGADIPYPYFKLNATNGSVNGSVLSNASGRYNIPVQAGTHTFTPALENPNYFNVSPASFTASFQADASPLTQNFCLTPNGQHPDLEVLLVPDLFARPGFDATYKLIYKNKGSVTLSGNLMVSNPNLVTFLSVEVAPIASSAGNQQWQFTNLRPFETHEILIAYRVNSPTETPAVHDGDILHFTAAINFGALDETPEDNTFNLNQTVVNSFDPNDKVCLEGASVSPYMVGKYVHYRIRFENTGTDSAQHIVLKDVIDTAKFDIASLVALDASHDFNTRINGNTVEFIFENIQLPFDDANNDGYVVFKIKTRPTLVVGDTFSNSASIYFDYNHPIVTDPAVTTISLLKNESFELAQNVVLYPNPATSQLHVQSPSAIKSITVYDALGRLVLAASSQTNLDVSGLKTGQYFTKIKTDQGVENATFVKK